MQHRPYEISKLIGGPFMRLLWQPTVTGIENVPASGGAIIASNHLSIVDSLFLPLIVPRQVTFAAKSEYFTGIGLVNRITAAYLRATNQLSVDRTGVRAGQAMLEAALGLVEHGGLFAIYPEGTRSPCRSSSRTISPRRKRLRSRSTMTPGLRGSRTARRH